MTDAWEFLTRGIVPIPPDVRAAFDGTDFECECGGIVVPQTMSDGVCMACKTRLKLEECEYTEDE